MTAFEAIELNTGAEIALWMLLGIALLVLTSVWVAWMALVWTHTNQFVKQYKLSKAVLEEEEARKKIEEAAGHSTRYLEDPSV